MARLLSYNYYKEVFSGKPMPYAFIDLDLLEKNIHDIAARVQNGKTVRVASKSVRCMNILSRIFSCGMPYKGIMAFHCSEAADLSAAGFDDILLGYPAYHQADIIRVLEEVKKGKTIRFMCDHEQQILQIDRLAATCGVVAEYCLDIDMSTDFPGLHFGVYRSPLHELVHVQELYRKVAGLKNARLAGIMGYEAQIAGVGDNIKGQEMKNAMVRMLKRRSIKDLSSRRQAVVNWLKSEGAELKIVNAGGTGSIETSSEEDWVTEVTAGSGFYSSGLFDNYSGFHHAPAAAFAIEITRIPAKGMFTCLGGGYIASGEIGISKQPKPYLPVGVELIKNEGCGEVQTPVKYSGKEELNIGDPLYFRHAKAGELCERFNTVYLVKNGEITDEVKTYRGEGKCYL